MKLTTKTPYAISACLYLAAVKTDKLVKCRDVCEPSGLPDKYVAQLLNVLTKANILVGVAGLYGGYKLAKPASKITVLEIIEAVEGPLANNGAIELSHMPAKAGRVMETALAGLVTDARKRFAAITLADLGAAKAA
ncbi:RrF2 family transcriptional regulator [Lacipirellula limnantheis]|uniref:HTH-type transcriptional regulator IscR n=1 Tax=Lacipirellula limnantheis TaxID=2528024 RepID=A0A517U1M6_9BACT|nr:Rrf2 family transcriptional regulator [Lacipirellula limnantheis]QDT74513.1 HTH-type transcriptional regulator IscR [Lacipirellula limnantheis]